MKAVFTVSIDTNKLEKLKEYCAISRQSMSAVVNIALDQFFKTGIIYPKGFNFDTISEGTNGK
jgi:hypothetical protein